MRPARRSAPPPGAPRLLGQYVFEPATDWKYTTVVVEVDEPFGSSMNFETDEVEWFPLDYVDQLPLHFGFAAAWPHLARDRSSGVRPQLVLVASGMTTRTVNGTCHHDCPDSCGWTVTVDDDAAPGRWP